MKSVTEGHITSPKHSKGLFQKLQFLLLSDFKDYRDKNLTFFHNKKISMVGKFP